MDELERDGLKNQAKGKMKKATGRIRDAAADLTGDDSENLRAKGKRLEGEIQDGFGEAQREIGEENRERRADETRKRI